MARQHRAFARVLRGDLRTLRDGRDRTRPTAQPLPAETLGATEPGQRVEGGCPRSSGGTTHGGAGRPVQFRNTPTEKRSPNASPGPIETSGRPSRLKSATALATAPSRENRVGSG